MINNMNIDQQISLKELFKQAKTSLKSGDSDTARDLIDFGLLRIAESKELGQLQNDSKIDGVEVDLWLTRLWVFLENNDLLLS
jgi:hypothetical protein